MPQPERPLHLPGRVLLSVLSIRWGTTESKYLLKGSERLGSREGEQKPRRNLPFLLHSLPTREENTGQDTHPAVGKISIALLHQDGFDEDGVENSQHRLPAVKNPKPRESHGQSIAHGQLE